MIVSTEELKTHLRIQQDAEDNLLESLLTQAQAAANDFCRTDFDAAAPEPVRLAVLLMASHFYECRDASDRSAYLTMMNAFHALLYTLCDVRRDKPAPECSFQCRPCHKDERYAGQPYVKAVPGQIVPSHVR